MVWRYGDGVESLVYKYYQPDHQQLARSETAGLQLSRADQGYPPGNPAGGAYGVLRLSDSVAGTAGCSNAVDPGAAGGSYLYWSFSGASLGLLQVCNERNSALFNKDI